MRCSRRRTSRQQDNRTAKSAVEHRIEPEDWIRSIRNARQEALGKGADFPIIVSYGESHYRSMISMTAEQVVKAARQATSLQQAVRQAQEQQAHLKQRGVREHDASSEEERKTQRNLTAQFDDTADSDHDDSTSPDSDTVGGKLGQACGWEAGQRPWDGDDASVRSEDLLEALGHPVVEHDESNNSHRSWEPTRVAERS